MEKLMETVWLDQKTEPAQRKHHNITTHHLLCNVDPQLKIFLHSNGCIDYITNLNEESIVLLIISKNHPSVCIDTVFLKLCEELSQVDSIEILQTAEDYGVADIPTEPSKIRKIYRDENELCTELIRMPHVQRNRAERHRTLDDLNSASMSSIELANSIIQHDYLSMVTEKRQESEFMYSQLLRDVLIDIDSTEDEMIEFCRNQCENNQNDLNHIEEFENYYDSCNAIFWYTRDTFLYRRLNKALRERNIDALYSMRYFIRDLHTQIRELYNLQRNIPDNIKHVANTARNLLNKGLIELDREPRYSVRYIELDYQLFLSEAEALPTTTIQSVDLSEDILFRGQQMSDSEFDKKIFHNQGGYLSVSSFFSTTRLEDRAKINAGDGSIPNLKSIIFRIHINKRVTKFPYADITEQSVFGAEEKEVLFTMGAVFQIVSVAANESQVWIVDLNLTGEEDIELQKLSESMKESMMMTTPLSSFASLMLLMCQYKRAEQLYQQLLEDDHFIRQYHNHRYVYSQLGYIYDELGEKDKALMSYEKSIYIARERLSDKDPLLAVPYNNVGQNYRDRGMLKEALTNYYRAVECAKNTENPSLRYLGQFYNNIGLVYAEQKQYEDALDMYQKSLDAKLKVLPKLHPSIATTFNNIGNLYYDQHNIKKALIYFRKALELTVNSVTSDDFSLTQSYWNLGRVLLEDGERSEALECLRKAYENLSREKSLDTSRVLGFEEWITQVERDLQKEKAQLEQSK